MKSNKGYSLAELLVSIAIFSVVMLSIVTVMRNVSISYRNENAEVQLQENSQILLSQMEELLVDCKSVTNTSTSTVKSWDIVDSYNVTHQIRLVGNTVQYQVGTSGFEDLANNVTGLEINGLQTSSGDDCCTIVVDMSNNVNGSNSGKSYDYSASKDIVFRNASVENSSAHDSSFLMGGSPDPSNPPSPNTINYEMGRYEVLNLISKFNVNPSATIGITGDTDAYSFIDPDGLNDDDYMEDITLLGDGETSAYLTTSDTCNTTTTSSYSCSITATTNGGQSITINISTSDVQLVKGSGVIYGPLGAINNGYSTYIKVKGINMRDAEEYYGISCTGKLEFNFSSGEKTGTIVSCLSSWSNWGSISGAMSSSTAIGYDPYSTDTLAIMFDSKLYESPYDENQWWSLSETEKTNRQNAIDNFNNASPAHTVKVTITYPDQDSTASTDETYKFYIQSAKLNNL